MALINTTQGELDELLLIKHEDSRDEDLGALTSIEYCLKDCSGRAHQANTPDSPAHFCAFHVHRSVHLTLKEGLDVTSALNAMWT